MTKTTIGEDIAVIREKVISIESHLNKINGGLSECQPRCNATQLIVDLHIKEHEKEQQVAMWKIGLIVGVIVATITLAIDIGLKYVGG